MNLFETRLISEERTKSIEQIKSFAGVLVGIAKKVNPTYAISWDYSIALAFGLKAWSLFRENKKLAENQVCIVVLFNMANR